MKPYLLEQTKRMWGVEGLWIPETVLPWGPSGSMECVFSLAKT
jgi:hypothetical protein